MAKRLEDMLWHNIRQIRSENDEQFARWVLEARSEFLRLRLRQEPALRKIYIDAADNIAREIRGLRPGVSELTLNQLQVLETSLRREAERISKGVGDRLEADISRAVQAGASAPNQQMLNVIKVAGVLAIDPAKVQRGFGVVNSAAVEAIWARTHKGMMLSNRIWQTGDKATDAIRAILQDAVARGRDAVKVARDLERYVRHGAVTLTQDYPNMMERMKGRVPKNLSYEALRLARTEMSNAFREGMYAAGRTNPSYKGVRWLLSASHPIEDICDDFASADLYGLGPGGYPQGEEPPIAHPNCLCYTVPIVEETQEFVERLERWSDDPESEPELEKWYNKVYKGYSGIQLKRSGLAGLEQVKPPSQIPPSLPSPGSEDNPIKIDNFAHLGGGVSKTYTGEIAGTKYLFKSADSLSVMNMTRSNLEAELLAERILNHLGVPTPKTDFAWFDTGNGVVQLLRMEFVQNAIEPSDFIMQYGMDAVDRNLFKRMQVVDVLIGNGDRHIENFLFPDDKSGRVIPIDHNLAFCTDRVFRVNEGWPKCFLGAGDKVLDLCQKPSGIIYRNDIGAYIFSRDGNDSYLPIVKDMQRRLTDSDIERMVNDLTADLAEPDRKAEMIEILKYRRDHMAIFIRTIK